MTNEERQRAWHRKVLGEALTATRVALVSAQTFGRRQDCLRVAEKALEGALRNCEGEDLGEYESATVRPGSG